MDCKHTTPPSPVHAVLGSTHLYPRNPAGNHIDHMASHNQCTLRLCYRKHLDRPFFSTFRLRAKRLPNGLRYLRWAGVASFSKSELTSRVDKCLEGADSPVSGARFVGPLTMWRAIKLSPALLFGYTPSFASIYLDILQYSLGSLELFMNSTTCADVHGPSRTLWVR